MKKLLIPIPNIESKTDDQICHSAIRETYLNKLAKYDLLPLFVSVCMTKKQINEMYLMADGVMFIGGKDIDPKLYGQKKHPKTEIDPKRDEIELYILKKTLKDKKPFLGICRGNQFLAVASGGQLTQHIPDKIGTQEIHHSNYCNLDKNKHQIEINKNSRLYKIIKKDKLAVNSAHHQAVSNPGKNISISAYSPAGIPEAIEHKDKDYFCFGVQSHPEFEKNSFFEKLFSEFKKSL